MDDRAFSEKEIIMIVRGGLGEPYCSQECHSRAGDYIAAVMLKNQEGVCGICQKPVQASMYGEPTCTIIPYESVNLFFCTECIEQGRTYLQSYSKCCMCQKNL
jgi:hypothetical protein